MAFSKEIKIDALVSAARHCCVCHRYKGVKVEVHHIFPFSEGGTDEPDNAIVLCFDCHSDAGHYSSNHPRGTKFSPEELKSARDKWYLNVKLNKITYNDNFDYIYYRYLVCKSYSAIREICEGTLDGIPVYSPLFFQNGISNFQKYIVDFHHEDYRSSQIWGETFLTYKEYIKKYPDAHILDRTNNNLTPFFKAQRFPTHQELQQRVENKDLVTKLLLNSKISSEKISSVLAYDDACGNGGFQEIYRLRPIWTVYLAISNISNQYILLKSLLCDYENASGISFRPFLEKSNSNSKKIKLPSSSIPPNATVVIPVSTLLGPLDGGTPELFWQDSSDISTGEVQIVGHGDGSNIISKTAIIGPRIRPKSIQVEDLSKNEVECQIREFDLSNLYIIDRFWECGSCPHLFLETSYGKKYSGELFAKTPNEVQINSIQIPSDVNSCIVAELEHEMTHIIKVFVNNNLLYSNVVLNKNDQFKYSR